MPKFTKLDPKDVHIPRGDLSALTDALARLRDERGLRTSMGEAALVRASREFSVEAMVGSYAELLGALSLRLPGRG